MSYSKDASGCTVAARPLLELATKNLTEKQCYFPHVPLSGLQLQERWTLSEDLQFAKGSYVGREL